jgi:hypothetical protein
MLAGGEAEISVFISFQWSLLLYEGQHGHDAKQLYLSAFLCVYYE